MRRTDLIHVIAGFLVTVGTVLAYAHSTYWLLLTLFVGLNLFQYGFTKWCLLDKILLRLGVDNP